WDAQHYFGTFRVADVTGDGNAEVCGRGYGGIVCWPFDGTSFGDTITGPAWGNEQGWSDPKYYVTLQMGGGCAPKPEVCNGKDDDCDGSVDEGDVCSSGNGDGGVAGSAGSGGGSWGKDGGEA